MLALAGLYGVAGLSRPMHLASATAHTGPLGHLPVRSALLGCPAPGSGGVTGGDIAEANAPSASGAGRVSVTTLEAASGAQAVATSRSSPPPGQLTIRTVKAAPALTTKAATLQSMAGGLVPTSLARGGLILSAKDSAAQGLDVEQLAPSGQPTTRCQAPGASFWFVCPGATNLHTELYLLNTDSQPADADLSVQTESGPQLGTPDAGIVVPPHTMLVQSLGTLLRGAKDIALHVTTTSGRVVAAVRLTTSLSKPGIWLPTAQEPSTTQVLTGLPSKPGQRELYITVPGSAEAHVNITAVTPHGSYPTGGNDNDLLGHLTTGIPLPALSGQPGSIVIKATVPVTAELEVSGGPSGAPGAFITGSDAVTEQGVVAASPVGLAGASEVVLSAPGHAAQVRITQALPGTALTGQAGQVITVPVKSSVLVKVKLPKHSPTKDTEVALLVTPLSGSGPVYAARVASTHAGGSIVDVLPVISSPTQIELPYVQSSLLAVLGS